MLEGGALMYMLDGRWRLLTLLVRAGEPLRHLRSSCVPPALLWAAVGLGSGSLMPMPAALLACMRFCCSARDLLGGMGPPVGAAGRLAGVFRLGGACRAAERGLMGSGGGSSDPATRPLEGHLGGGGRWVGKAVLPKAFSFTAAVGRRGGGSAARSTPRVWSTSSQLWSIEAMVSWLLRLATTSAVWPSAFLILQSAPTPRSEATDAMLPLLAASCRAVLPSAAQKSKSTFAPCWQRICTAFQQSTAAAKCSSGAPLSSVFMGSAPYCSSNSKQSVWSRSSAIFAGVWPFESSGSMLTWPCADSRRALRPFRLPLRAQQCSGVWPATERALALAPCCSSMLTSSADCECERPQARCSGDSPVVSACAPAEAPRLSSNADSRTWPLRTEASSFVSLLDLLVAFKAVVFFLRCFLRAPSLAQAGEPGSVFALDLIIL
mmetsp:Transcript_20200/g.77354  ORF Transcript_20200/g.77354 Transcript_20200/m.77354 type:complete len:435 (-) Transcript_20200:478-1782(-)